MLWAIIDVALIDDAVFNLLCRDYEGREKEHDVYRDLRPRGTQEKNLRRFLRLVQVSKVSYASGQIILSDGRTATAAMLAVLHGERTSTWEKFLSLCEALDLIAWNDESECWEIIDWARWEGSRDTAKERGKYRTAKHRENKKRQNSRKNSGEKPSDFHATSVQNSGVAPEFLGNVRELHGSCHESTSEHSSFKSEEPNENGALAGETCNTSVRKSDTIKQKQSNSKVEVTAAETGVTKKPPTSAITKNRTSSDPGSAAAVFFAAGRDVHSQLVPGERYTNQHDDQLKEFFGRWPGAPPDVLALALRAAGAEAMQRNHGSPWGLLRSTFDRHAKACIDKANTQALAADMERRLAELDDGLEDDHDTDV